MRRGSSVLQKRGLKNLESALGRGRMERRGEIGVLSDPSHLDDGEKCFSDHSGPSVNGGRGTPSVFCFRQRSDHSLYKIRSGRRVDAFGTATNMIPRQRLAATPCTDF